MKIGLFINVSDLYNYCTTTFQKKVNYSKLEKSIINYLQGETSIKFAYGLFGKEVKSVGFERTLKHLGYTPRLFHVADRRYNLSSNMTVDIMANINDVDTFVIYTTNNDIIPAINYLKSIGKSIVFIGNPAKHLLKLIDDVIPIHESEMETKDDTTEVPTQGFLFPDGVCNGNGNRSN